MFRSAFDVLGLRPIYDLDLKKLDQVYFRLQSQFHPDRFVGVDDFEKVKVETQSSNINQAYEDLKDPLKRLQQMILHVNLTIPHQEGDTLTDPEALMEAIDMQEQLEKLVIPLQFAEFRQMIEGKFNDLVDKILGAWEIKDQKEIDRLYPRLSYLWKLHESARAQNRASVLKVL